MLQAEFLNQEIEKMRRRCLRPRRNSPIRPANTSHEQQIPTYLGIDNKSETLPT